MWTVPRPSDTAHETYQACISKIRNPQLRARYAAAAASIEQAAERYRVAAEKLAMHQLSTDQFRPENGGLGVDLNINSSDLSKGLYKQRMAKPGSAGRDVYDRLLMGSSVCPLCGQQQVKTLDHYLPKSSFPALSVAPLNLIPACYDCNRIKLDALPKSAAEQTFHPYFDNIPRASWLLCEVIESSPATVQFSVGQPPEWNPLHVERMRHHFRVFGLAEMYAFYAVGTIGDMRQNLALAHQLGGASVVSDVLQGDAISARKNDPAGWKGALFDALSKSTWFCSGGFA